MNKTLNMRKSKIEEVNNILNKNYELTYEDLYELVDAYNKNKDIRKIVKKKTKIKVEKEKKNKIKFNLIFNLFHSFPFVSSSTLTLTTSFSSS